jgi:hypothetical protein
MNAGSDSATAPDSERQLAVGRVFTAAIWNSLAPPENGTMRTPACSRLDDANSASRRPGSSTVGTSKPPALPTLMLSAF